MQLVNVTQSQIVQQSSYKARVSGLNPELFFRSADPPGWATTTDSYKGIRSHSYMQSPR